MLLYCCNFLQGAYITFVIKDKEKKRRKEIEFDTPPSNMKPFEGMKKNSCASREISSKPVLFFLS